MILSDPNFARAWQEVRNAADGAANEARIAHFQALNQPPEADLTEDGTEDAWDGQCCGGPRARSWRNASARLCFADASRGWVFATEQLHPKN